MTEADPVQHLAGRLDVDEITRIYRGFLTGLVSLIFVCSDVAAPGWHQHRPGRQRQCPVAST